MLDVKDGRKALACLIFGLAIAAAFLIDLVWFTPPASAAGMPCTSMPNKDVLAHLEKNSQETVKFVGAVGTGEAPFPMEVTVSAGGTWSILVLTPDGVCFMAVGTDWQAVEPKPAWVKN